MSKAIGVSLFALLVATSAQAQQIGDVFYIALENHNFTQPSTVPAGTPQQLFGNTAAPYLNSLVTPGNPNAANVSFAGNYQNVSPNQHPSEPNYVYQVAGLTGPLNDNDPYPNNIVNAPNLSQLMAAKGQTWRSYQEDIDLVNTSGITSTDHGAGVSLTSTVAPKNQYEVPTDVLLRHVRPPTPIPTTAAINTTMQQAQPGSCSSPPPTGNGNSPEHVAANPQAQNYAPLQQLQTDLTNNTVAQFNWITPDQYNDMHSSLNTSFTYNGVTYAAGTDQEAVALGDNFLSMIVPEIEASQAFKDNGEIVIWNDETEGDETVGSTAGFDGTEIIISPLAKGNAYTNNILYTHASDLVTLQNIFGVAGGGAGGYLGGAGGANSLADLFKPGVIPSAIPEPSTWVMMGLGFAGLAGAAAYRRKLGAAAKPAAAC